MTARQHIASLLKEWLELTKLESHAIQIGRWTELAKIEKAKAGLEQPLLDAIEKWNLEPRHDGAANIFRVDIKQLLELESSQSKLLAVRKREVREKKLLLEQALEDLRYVRSALKSEAA
jgi:hypothetical protein